ncbi:hypothetical protein OKW96_17480 [Sphingobacterium sp. KU25419]|nr:hypothetical protein OKW96_17480 [Sphingobacterium sp. KU25419]
MRRPYFEYHDKLEEIIVDFDKLFSFQDQISGDVAFFLFRNHIKRCRKQRSPVAYDYDYPFHFAKMSFENGVTHFVLLSAAGVNAKSRIFYNRMKGS